MVSLIRNDEVSQELGDHQATNVAHKDGGQAVVEQRRTDAKPLAFVNLRRAGRPAILVGTVTPDGATDQNDQCNIGQNAPQQDVYDARIGYSVCSVFCALRSKYVHVLSPQG